ncbi:MAG TPA: SRPBCC family protein [Phycisphaerae bacterium]|nr:SRPBCC family protein [Phycisphaerae bacterium]
MTEVPSEARKLNERGLHVSQACTINAPASELFRFWRHFENLPRFMSHLESVTTRGDGISHWKAKAPFGQEVQWDAEIISEEPDRVIAWRSLQGAQVENAGSVRFIDTGDRGTEVHVVIDYVPPAGKFGNMLAKLIGEDPSGSLREDLRRFKQLMETGELATSEGPRGTCGHKSKSTSTQGDRK